MSLVRPYDQFVGIDIAAKTATVVIQPAADAVPSRPFVIEQTADGLATLQRSLRHGQSNPATTLVVLEATGSYWITLATTLHHAGYAVSVINPAQAHHFAKALLRRSKTDAIDAQTLTRLAATLQPAPWTPPPAVYHELQQRLAQRDAWIAMRQQIRNQRHALTQQSVVVAAVVTRMDDLIATLDAQITEIEAELRPALAGDAGWEAAAARLESIKGIGLITASWILVTTLNFTLCATPEAAVAYAGLAPREAESGTSVRRRACIGKAGNARLRTALYMATLSAAQSNPAIKRFYTRLRDAGKVQKVARCAAARKLLHVAWAVVVHERMWQPDYHQQHTALAQSTA
ncbi:MAG: IS110 family transposase [Chloroflexota bacterium]|nr:IS110 family transposase [Chloroflexota bacterium]